MIGTAPSIELLGHQPGATVARWRGQRVTRERFIGHARHLAETLPDRRFAANLCRDRYVFLVALSAALMREQSTLLPHGPSPKLIAQACEPYDDVYVLSDHAAEVSGLEELRIETTPGLAGDPSDDLPRIPADLLAAILFTSGSTGQPQSSPKRWSELVAGARSVARRFGFEHSSEGTLVATVPPHHMYGLEASLMLPLVCGLCVHGATPLFPDSIGRALASGPGPRWLLATPAHLRACVELSVEWPEIELVISSSAPLAADLAARVESALGAPVFEIYGCTEAGGVATRRTVRGGRWQPCEGIELILRGDTPFVSAPHLPEPVALNDRLELHEDGRFELVGRDDDLLKVAGVRALLSDLNLKLNAIEGVQDGVYVMPEQERDGPDARPIALVVAPGVDKKVIVAALAQSVHPAFLPRPLYVVERLPRNRLGKLPREALLSLIASLSSSD